jgi:hypothetical protein
MGEQDATSDFQVTVYLRDYLWLPGNELALEKARSRYLDEHPEFAETVIIWAPESDKRM